MKDFKLFRVMGQDAREILNTLKTDLKARAVKERAEGIARIKAAKERREQLAMRERVKVCQKEVPIAQAKGATFTPQELAELEAEIIAAKW